MRIGVVGGGVVGLSTAWYLRRGGADPVVVEAGSAGGGCSRGNAGWVCPSISSPLPAPGLTLTSLARMLAPGSPLYIRPAALPQLRRWLARFRSHCTNADYAHGIRALAALNAKTMDRFQQFSEDGVQFEYHRTALLCAFREPKKAEAMRAEVEAIAAESNTSYHAVSESELYDQEPMLRPGFCSGLLIESNLHVRPETLTGGLARALSSRGVVVREGVSVTGFKTEGRQVRALLTTTGAIDVDAVVIAAGAHSGRLARAAGTPIPLTAGKGYSVTVERPRNQLRQPLYLGEAKVGLTPFRNALRFSGTMELSGLNQRLDPKRVRALRRAAGRSVDIPEAKVGGSVWVGMRPMVPDTLPVTGKLPTRRNVYINTGHQMLGVTLGPGTGEALARLILGEQPETDLSPFSPTRF